MVVDSSAIVAVLLNEPRAPHLENTLAGAGGARVSAATYVEASIVMGRRHGEAGLLRVDRLLARFRVTIEDVDGAQAALARAAFLRFGKGRHSAALNFGDCFSYALATVRQEPLLFVGDDFGRTDVRVA